MRAFTALFGLLALLFSAAARATPPDVSSVVTAIGEATTPIGLIGAAVLLVLVVIKVYKWVRRAM
jgi:uncharacterized membrane protein